MNTILIYTLEKKIWKFGKPPGKFRNLEILSPWKNFILKTEIRLTPIQKTIG